MLAEIPQALIPSLGAVLLAVANLLYAEARLRRARAGFKDARRRAIDAQRAAGATRRDDDDPSVVKPARARRTGVPLDEEEAP